MSKCIILGGMQLLKPIGGHIALNFLYYEKEENLKISYSTA